jgi:DNA modification methylase
MNKKVNIVSIKPNDENPRFITDSKFKKLIKSIKSFPEMLEARPLVVDENMMVLGGNMRLKALKSAGIFEVPINQVLGWTEEQKKEFIVKDNVGFGEWDWDILANQYDQEELVEWGMDLPEFPTEEVLEAEEDDYEQPDEMEVDVVLGDLIEIGEHRLFCGDSTDSDQVAKLMGGDKWDLLATSPPYNQGNSCGNLLHTKGLGVGKKNVKLYNDKNQDNRTSQEYFNFCIDILKNASLFKNEKEHTLCWNVSYNAKSRDDYGKIVFSDLNPFKVKETIIWDKNHSINLPQIGIYSRRCEFVFVMSANDKYKTSQKYNDCRWNIWNIKSSGSQITGDEVEHRATYPVEFANNMINDFSLKQNIILDVFLGSGTTMVASHQLNRICYGMELDPKYCQVIIDRMKKLDPSLKVKINGKEYKSQ